MGGATVLPPFGHCFPTVPVVQVGPDRRMSMEITHEGPELGSDSLIQTWGQNIWNILKDFHKKQLNGALSPKG
jgi:hypothetical protein